MNSVFIIPIILVLFGTLWLYQEQRIGALEAHQECLIRWLDTSADNVRGQGTNRSADSISPVGYSVNTDFAFARDDDNDNADYNSLYSFANDLYHGRISELNYMYSVAGHRHSLDFVQVQTDDGTWDYNTFPCMQY